MIYKTIDSFVQFSDEFHRCGREKQFSYEALGALYEYLEDLGDDYELDVVGLCCEFCEEPLTEVLKNYNLKSFEELREHTTVVAHFENDNVLYVEF